ncbi:CagC family type IV secretion system protein [Leuconostoc mesenteroides]|uniref:Conjugal transfer protein (Plasmid) [Lactobacillus plantarum] n=2 Tax=Lactiplantibacillus TaxID=2767842 RepID=A0A660E0M8_9LACO|nr:conjugal transfer protein [Leuconostoc mesenteroides]VDG25047.1 conjugal transfer protein (plasmid) [Lactobacillus plantarum] [Lactiplantibacillus mudanjiangensis]VDG28937.1 conjugal transfer protein (plasmid) [Lactobacillus plantarum] [Lactiplantibacillus mudanjiangensis]
MKILNKSKITSILASVSTAGYLMLTNAQIVLAADGSEVQSKITNAANTIKGILTGIVVLVGVCVALFIIIKRLPDADDPREKSEVYKAVGRVAGLVALAAAIVWILPWVYSLFT